MRKQIILGAFVGLAFLITTDRATAEDSSTMNEATPVDLDGDGLSDAMLLSSPRQKTSQLIRLNSGTKQAAALSEVCTSFVSKGWLYKPKSQDSGPPREGKPLVLFSSNSPSKKARLKIYASNGTEICNFKRWDSRRFYSGSGCNKTGAQLADLARAATGNDSDIYIETTGTKCIGPLNARDRKDRR